MCVIILFFFPMLLQMTPLSEVLITDFVFSRKTLRIWQKVHENFYFELCCIIVTVYFYKTKININGRLCFRLRIIKRIPHFFDMTSVYRQIFYKSYCLHYHHIFNTHTLHIRNYIGILLKIVLDLHTIYNLGSFSTHPSGICPNYFAMSCLKTLGPRVLP